MGAKSRSIRRSSKSLIFSSKNHKPQDNHLINVAARPISRRERINKLSLHNIFSTHIPGALFGIRLRIAVIIMYLPQFAAFAVTLLCIPGFIQSLPTSSGSALITRGEDVPDNLKPVLQDDGLPDGNPNDALIDDDLDNNNSHDNDDYDPDQDQTTSAKRLLVRGVRKGTTQVLRAVGFNSMSHAHLTIFLSMSRFGLILRNF